MSTSLTVRAAATVLGLALLAACGGKAIVTSDAGGGGGSGSSSGGEACAEVPLSSFDTSCQVDTDCVSVVTGMLCPGACNCGGSTINQSSQSDWQSQAGRFLTGNCFCPDSPAPRCIGGTCTLCTGGPSDPPACNLMVADAGQACVYIPPSTYTTACNTASDCTYLPSGKICSGECECGGMAVNQSGEAAFTMATAGIQFAGCPCPPGPPLGCVGGACTQCQYDDDGGIICGDGG